MLRRSLRILLACVMLVLALVLGYALLGLSGPEVAVRTAREQFAAKHYARCVRLLDITEGSLGPRTDVALRRELLDLRRLAHTETGNWALALRDVRKLREIDAEDVALARAEIELTIRTEDPAGGLALAERYLSTRPDDGEVLGFAGIACQARYQELVAEIVRQLGSQLDPTAKQHAFTALRSWLYRDPGDPLASLGLERFSAVLAESRPDLLINTANRQALTEIHGLIAKSQGFFRLALETSDGPIAAYSGVAYAMQQGERTDDRQWLAELYVHRFTTIHALRAAIDLADLHLRHERWAAVVEIAERFLPRGTWSGLLDAERIDATVKELYLAHARALDQLGDATRLHELALEVEAIETDGRISLLPETHWILALDARRRGALNESLKLLRDYDQVLAVMPPDATVVERRIKVFDERIALAKQQGWGQQFFDYVYRTLAYLDPNSPKRYLDQTYFRIATNDPEGALLDVRNAMRVAAQDEEVLRAQAVATDHSLKKSDRDSAAQLERCIQLEILVPDAPDVLMPLIAELALQQKRPDIARSCAESAVKAFPWARWPRHVHCRALLDLGDPIAAERAATELLSFHPRDEQGLLDLRESRIALGRGHDDLLRQFLLSGRRDGIVAASLLRRAAERADLPLANHFAQTVDRHFRDEPEALLAVADIQERLGNLDKARATLAEVAAETIATRPATFARSYDRWTVISAKTGAPDAELQAMVERLLVLHTGDAERLTILAEEFADAGQPRWGYLLLTPVLTEDAHRAQRTGRQYLLAGRLALRLRLDEAAERHFVQALSFQDGAAASRDLALHLLSLGRDAEAKNSFWESEIRDLVSAALFARFGRLPEATGWVRRRLEGAPADLPVLALAAVLGIERGVPNPAGELAQNHRAELLDAITFLDATGFESIAQSRLDALLADSPGDPVTSTLHAHLLARQGKPDAALQLLKRVIEAAPLLVPAYDEAARIIDATGVSVLGGDVVESPFVRPELLSSGLSTPSMVALATRQHVRALIDQFGGRVDRAEELAAVWIASAGSGGIGLQQIELLGFVGRPDLGLQLADAVEPHVPDADQPRFQTTYFLLADLALRQKPDGALESRIHNHAQEIIKRSGPNGAIVNYLIDREVARNGPIEGPRESPRLRKLATLLGSLFDRLRTTTDTASQLTMERSLRRYAELHGRAAALELLDQQLDAEPTLLTLWNLRADWLVAEGEPAAALESLRWSYDFLPQHEIALRCVELALRHGDVQAADRTAFERLRADPTLGESPRARFVAAMFAIRDAEYAKADELFEKVADSPDGAHFYYRALALLTLGRADEAKAQLEALASAHPDSPLTSSAAHFARQLAR